MAPSTPQPITAASDDAVILPHPSRETSEKSSVGFDDDGQRKHDVPEASDGGHDENDDLFSQFKGWMGLDEKSVDGALKLQSFQPKKWEETDVDIKITHCGLCGSDLHVLRSGWVAHQTADTCSTLRC